MRWDGESKDDAGYPKTFGHPVWFVIPDELAKPFVTALLAAADHVDGVRNIEILHVLMAIEEQASKK